MDSNGFSSSTNRLQLPTLTPLSSTTSSSTFHVCSVNESSRNAPRIRSSDHDSSTVTSSSLIDDHTVATNPQWIRSSMIESHYCESRSDRQVKGTDRLQTLQLRFNNELVQRSSRIKAEKIPFEFPSRKPQVQAIKRCVASGGSSGHHLSHHCCSSDELSTDSDDSTDEDNDDDDENDDEHGDSDQDSAYEELQKKRTHPWRLHDELWYNDPGEMNDGPLCRCSAKARKTGIRHGIYPGEDPLTACSPDSDNRDRLHHYRLVIKPDTNFTTKFPTTIDYDGHSFAFEGFSLLSHRPLPTNYPPCKLIRFNIEYELSIESEKFPCNFTIRDLDLFSQYLFGEILELEDLDWRAAADPEGCPRFHVYPRFSRPLTDNGIELLPMHALLTYLLQSSTPLITEDELPAYKAMSEDEWIKFATRHKGMIVTYPGMKPSSIRVDQLDRELDAIALKEQAERATRSQCERNDSTVLELDVNDSDTPAVVPSMETDLSDDWPIIVHFGIRPPQLSYAGNPKYQKTWRDFVKYRHLLANKPKVTFDEKQLLLKKEEKLQEMRLKSDLKRDCTITITTKGFIRTGIFCDVIQYALVLPVMVCHLRFHESLKHLEEEVLHYNFNDRYLLQLALTHPSYRENFGTNADHARNSLTNCGIRQPYYGDRKVHFMNTRKRGINMLINIMSRFGHNRETTSSINHNERLEFLGDAVVEFLSSIHLYHIFPDLEEGGLATYRAAIVQNQHLALLAKNLQLNKYMLYAHGSDLCHDFELKHAMANCFEALIGALFLDGGINVADNVFSNTLFWVGDTADHVVQPANPMTGCCHDSSVEHQKRLLNHEENQILKQIWIHYNPHPIQMQEPDGDRHYIAKIPRLQVLCEFEQMTGIEFTHIRLLARAFTHRSVGFNNLTLGSNQRMEFLGDTVLQLIASEYLYKYFPEHHEGHLSLLRSSLVNNKTQAVVCDDLGMTKFAVYNYAKGELKTKDRADLLEAFLGALYVDKGLDFCKRFCETCFFPRLEHFIMNQDWNDPKSKLQQCCLTLRSIDGGEPDIPIYKVIECLGPTNTRVYKVAVYFRDQRLETGSGHSIQEAEMDAASNALKAAKELFPQLNHQKRVIERSVKQQEPETTMKSNDSSSIKRRNGSKLRPNDKDLVQDTNRNRNYCETGSFPSKSTSSVSSSSTLLSQSNGKNEDIVRDFNSKSTVSSHAPQFRPSLANASPIMPANSTRPMPGLRLNTNTFAAPRHLLPPRFSANTHLQFPPSNGYVRPDVTLPKATLYVPTTRSSSPSPPPPPLPSSWCPINMLLPSLRSAYPPRLPASGQTTQSSDILPSYWQPPPMPVAWMNRLPVRPPFPFRVRLPPPIPSPIPPLPPQSQAPSLHRPPSNAQSNR